MSKWSSEKVNFQSLTEGRQRRCRRNFCWKTIPNVRSGYCECSSNNCWQFEWWHHQAVSATRANRLSTSQMGDTNNRSEIIRCDHMPNVTDGDLVDDALWDAQPVQADQCICNVIKASKSEDQPCSCVFASTGGGEPGLSEDRSAHTPCP